MPNYAKTTIPFSVLLSVYKKEDAKYLDCAMSSIYDQQYLKPTQIVLVLDGPLTTALHQVIARWKAKLGDVLTLVPLKKNVGLAKALNAGLEHCCHELVARMDTDDMAMPDRFQRQMEFMSKHPEIAVSSGQVDEYCNNLENQISTRTLPLTHSELIRFAKKRNPISHPCVVFRKNAVMEVGGYPEIYPEDYPLWALLLANGYQFANLPDTLLKMRVGDALSKRRGFNFLKGEIETFRLMHQIGLITRYEFCRNVTQRTILRLAPETLKKAFYKLLR